MAENHDNLTKDRACGHPVVLTEQDAQNREIQERFVNHYCGVNVDDLTWADLEDIMWSWRTIQHTWTYSLQKAH